MPSSSVTNKQIFSDRHLSALHFGFFTPVWLTCCFTGHISLDEHVPLNRRLLVSALFLRVCATIVSGRHFWLTLVYKSGLKSLCSASQTCCDTRRFFCGSQRVKKIDQLHTDTFEGHSQ